MLSTRGFLVKVPNWLRPRWWEVAYLIIGPEGWRHEKIIEVIETKPDERFNKIVMEHVSAWIEAGEMPPDAIAPAIMNLADDYMAGRTIQIRAGDYIALQSFVRERG